MMVVSSVGEMVEMKVALMDALRVEMTVAYLVLRLSAEKAQHRAVSMADSRAVETGTMMVAALAPQKVEKTVVTTIQLMADLPVLGLQGAPLVHFVVAHGDLYYVCIRCHGSKIYMTCIMTNPY